MTTITKEKATVARSRAYLQAKNPLTDSWEPAVYRFSHFGRGIDGIRFADGTIYNPAVVPIKSKSV